MNTNPRAVADKLTAAYREIHRTAMSSLPICNDALAIEAIGFRDFDGYVLGVIITPWFLNLVMVAQQAAHSAASLPTASSVHLRFPAGGVDFKASELQGFGRLASCSLFSPMSEFVNHDAAREVAQAALDALFDPNLHETEKEPAARANTVDRRAFLGGPRKERARGSAP
jgi:[NiFe] hydrogenase assembly HybE family chaperone